MAKIGCNRRCYRIAWRTTSARRTRFGWSRSSSTNWTSPPWGFGDDAGGDGPAGLSSLDAAEDLPLRLSQSRAVEPAARTGSAAQYRADVAHRPAGAGLQDDCRLPQGQWRGDPGGVRTVRRALPRAH